MNIKKKQFFRRILTGVLCSAVIVTQAVPVFATDEYGAPLVTATPTPDPHTAYYKQPADTDSIKDWTKGPQIEGESAILVDMFTGAVLYSKNADKAQYPASITKIMTALLGCENLDPSQKFTMSESAAYGISDSNSSSIYADTGEEFTIEQALMAVMLQSANEMTLAVAELTSGCAKKFVEQMNLKARQLGCTNTHFNNPNGLPDETHYTTASDMAKIARAAWFNPTFRKFASTLYYEIPPTNKFAETRYLLNHHKMMKSQAYAYDGVLGGKTGYTEAAGNTLVTYAKNDNTYLVAVVLQSVNGAYADTASLLDYGFDNFSRTAVKDLPDKISATYLPAEKYLIRDYRDSSLFETRRTASVSLPSGKDLSTLKKSYSITKNPAGLPLVTVTYTYNDHPVGTARYYQTRSLSDQLL
ncbi:D-alanyl-D-alanine carboxypeptidase family protein [Blautia sp. MSJ-19]|uniref:D-alanyl-D-alanine carboxypeptidase family protein n=1 Tax=Blautia sp. MSJ-19 TaxID=2841517 RepID=UPI001C0F0EA9|nr:D-alanyl-D-alanine carboxypeptidase family protein [Blautia sp. MSJ-19]MBU5482107.1 D-alanyl-D-alanine carboxypeptidase [Blautia sp. MSJ-19]